MTEESIESLMDELFVNISALDNIEYVQKQEWKKDSVFIKYKGHLFSLRLEPIVGV